MSRLLYLATRDLIFDCVRLISSLSLSASIFFMVFAQFFFVFAYFQVLKNAERVKNTVKRLLYIAKNCDDSPEEIDPINFTKDLLDIINFKARKKGVVVCGSREMRANRQVVDGGISQIKLFNAGSGWRTLTCVLVYVYAYAIGYSYYRRGELEV